MDYYGFLLPDATQKEQMRSEGNFSDRVMATGGSMYPTEKIPEEIGSVYWAIHDCDLNNGPIYRPAGICYTAVINIEGNKNILIDFKIKNDVTKKIIAPLEMVKKITSSLKKY